MQPDFTAKKGWYTPHELGYLANALGFPRCLLVGVFQVEIEVLGETAIREKSLIEVLASKALDSKLDRSYNRYDAKYNIKLILKSVALLRHRALTFKELSDARVSFEMYASDDGTGMDSKLETVQQALKLVNRIVSPLKLDHEIRKFVERSEIPGRLQMYEFLDFVPMCDTLDQAESRFHKALYEKETANTNAPDFGRLLTTTQQQVVSFLDEEYRLSLHHREAEPNPPAKDDTYVINSDLRRSTVSLSREEFSCVVSSVRNSTTQLQIARSGRSPFTEGQCASLNTILKFSCSRSRAHSHKPPSFSFRAQSNTNKGVLVPQSSAQRSRRVAKADTAAGSNVDRNKSYTASVLRARGTLTGSAALILPEECLKLEYSSLTDTSLCAQKTEAASRPYVIEPLVTSQDRSIHQGLINDLAWRTLQKQRKAARIPDPE